MQVIEIVSAIVLLVVSVLLIAVIMLQKNRGRGLDGSFGNAGSGFEGRRGQTTDMALSRWTKILGVAFVIVTIAANVIAIILK